MENKNIHDYRQPMVTATGIFLGFLLNFVTEWMPQAFSVHRTRDTVIAISIVSSMTLLVTVLFRMLRMHFTGSTVEEFYKKTLYMLITGICIPFFAMVIIIIEKLFKLGLIL